MENIDFITKTVKRIHDVYVGKCAACPLYNFNCTVYLELLEHLESEEESSNLLTTLKDWNKKHPIMTNREKLKEVFGDFQKATIFSSEWLDAEYTYRCEKEK